MGELDSSSIKDVLKRAKEENFMGLLPATAGPTPGPYSAPCGLSQSLEGRNAEELYVLAEALLSDPYAVKLLGDRIYELMQKDIQEFTILLEEILQM